MATSVRFPIASTLLCSSSSSSSSASPKRRSFRVRCQGSGDHFLKKLSYIAANNPEALKRRQNSDMPPYLDAYVSPQLMANPAQLERSATYNEHRPRTPPPDLPSLLLHGRIVYIGMPLVSAVTELIVSELMYLQFMDPEMPIYIYINSTGTTRDDGETVALESEGFAIYDAMMRMKCEIHTVGLGNAVGQACLLLAAGTKGKRFMLPHAKAMIQQPRVPNAGLMQASDVLIRTNEAVVQRDTLIKLLARHTGNSKETVAKAMERPFYMDATKAKEFGVIDKILEGKDKVMSDIAKAEEWDKKAGIRPFDAMS